MKVVFRTDASQDIGSGHVMRCLTLAHALKGQGVDVLFICRTHPGNLITLIREEGFSCSELPVQDGWLLDPEEHATWLGAPAELDAAHTATSIASSGIADWLIVDHYGVGLEWEQWIRPVCRNLMVIDDLANRDHDCDLLLDQNLVANMLERYCNRVGTECVKLLGTRYTLLQPTYSSLHRQARVRSSEVRNVFAYFGGADTVNLTGRIIQAFVARAKPDISLDVVVAPSSPYWNEIRQQVEGDSRIKVHGFVPSLAFLLSKADVAFGAGGATSWERCCLGLPAYVITLADNQLAVTAELAQQGVIRYVGHSSTVSEFDLCEAMSEALSGQYLSEMSKRAIKHVDGLGAIRVLARLLASPEMSFHARLASQADEYLLLDWANDAEVRKQSFSTSQIDEKTHAEWLRQRLLLKESCIFYIVETSFGLPVAPVRFEKRENHWELHYLIEPCLRNCGVGMSILKTALEVFRNVVSGEIVISARVKMVNLASQRIFEKLGFSGSVEREEVAYCLALCGGES